MTDEYYNRAKQEGYRSRAAYKLKQLDREADLIAEGDTVVDLGYQVRLPVELFELVRRPRAVVLLFGAVVVLIGHTDVA